MATRNIQTAFRFDNATINQLDNLCQLWNINRTECITRLINSAYDSVQGNPQLKEMLEKLNELRVYLDKCGNEQTTITFSDNLAAK